MNSALTYTISHQSQFLSELQRILEIPSISTIPENKPDIERMAEWLRVHLLEIGLDNASIFQTDGHPIVYGEWLRAKDRPTLLIYGHYDVQPPDPIDQWHTSPFQPIVKGDYIYGRGTSDDKAQFFTHLKAIQSYLSTNKKLPINIKILLEGEEELGSTHLEQFISQNKQLLACDTVVISDGHMATPNQPLIEISTRGLAYFEIHLQTAANDLHSGMFGGGVVNAPNELIKILNQLKDKNQKITIPGFYDDVKPISPKLQKQLYADKQEFQTSAKAFSYTSESKTPSHLMPGNRPSLDINGIISGFTGTGQKTVIPSTAIAKVSTRLVCGQNPHKVAADFTKYIKKLTPKNLKVEIKTLSAEAPVEVSPNSRWVRAAELSLHQTFKRKPKLFRVGGTLPIVEMLQRILKTDSVLMGYGLPNDNLHAPNERFYLPHFYKGIANNIRFYQKLSRLQLSHED